MVDSVNPRSLKAAREQRKLDLFEVSDFTGISADRLEAFERGKHRPSLRQVEVLSQLYNVPYYLLYLDVIPNLEEVLPDFRKVHPGPADLSPRGLVRIWSTQKVAQFTKQILAELTDRLPKFRDLPRQSKLTKKFAVELRGNFDEWFHKRESDFGLSGSLEAKYLSAARLFYESHLKLSLVNEAPPSDYFGFYNEPAAGLPSIFVNRSVSSKKAQLFTFMHELGHSLLGTEGVSDPFEPANSVERSCNKFAAEFLAPQSEFASVVESAGRTVRSDALTLVSYVSSRCLLSRQATAVRLAELDYIDDARFLNWKKSWKSDPSQEKDEEKANSPEGGPGAFAKQLGELGCLSVYLAAEGAASGLLDSLDIQRGMGLSESVQEKAFALARRRLEAAVR